MKIRLSGADRERMAQLTGIQENNARALQTISAYLVRRARWVEAADVDSVSACGVTEEQAYVALMSAGMGLDEQDNPKDRALVLDYIAPAMRKLEADTYRNDPYFRSVRVPEKTVGSWNLGMRRYAPYEAFVRNDVRLYDDFREVPQLGFFSETFIFPAVMENGNEWMTVTPNEVETMKEAVSRARGRVAAYGLGLGYFAFMASEKSEVTGVTVIERDEQAIRLFEEEILPQFPHREKIEIVCADAFDYAARGEAFDVAFVDLWHDVSDGIDLYLRMKKLEEKTPGAQFIYWIEKSLLSHLRFHLFWRMEEATRRRDEELGKLLGREEICSFEEIENLLGERSLKEMALRLENINQLKGI
ncbi:MAG: hypothetical protein IJE08_11585 [Clostridia bacterium]|nr:hypothetical protein [Clostridia bacterium]